VPCYCADMCARNSPSIVVIQHEKSVSFLHWAFPDVTISNRFVFGKSMRRAGQPMNYKLVPASNKDEEWLERLRRSVYRGLFIATFGGWDEARHQRHCSECLSRGGISIIEIADRRVGMIQLFHRPDEVEIGEIQIRPSQQNRGIGSRVLKDTIAQAHQRQKKVVLSVALKNERAFRLYERLGFQKVGNNETHNLMVLNNP
jgi:ribosomal protein S18 acetylase RimI-like enzyme